MSARLSIEALTAVERGRTILDSVTLSLGPGVVLGVVGPNGAGKTTLLRAALGLRSATGEVRLNGQFLSDLGPAQRVGRIGYLPQERRVAWNMSALDVAALGVVDLAPEAARQVAQACLTEMEVGDLSERGVLDMSGGERARVLMARLLATRASLILADEPAAGLDPEAQFLAMACLRQRAATGASVIVTLHDLTLAARACDRLAVLHHGRLRALAPPTEALSAQILAEVFGLEGSLFESAAGLTLAAQRLELTVR